MEIYEIFNKDGAEILTHSSLVVSAAFLKPFRKSGIASLRHIASRIENGIVARRCGAWKKRNDKYFTRKLVSPFAQAENTKTRLEWNGRSRNLFISAPFRGGVPNVGYANFLARAYERVIILWKSPVPPPELARTEFHARITGGEEVEKILASCGDHRVHRNESIRRRSNSILQRFFSRPDECECGRG